MKTRLPLLLTLALSLILSSCGKKTHESLIEDQIEQMEALAKVMNTIDDVSSAEAAKPEIEKIKKRMDEITTAMEEIGEPTEEQEKALKEKYKDRLEKATKDMMSAMMKIAFKPEVQKVLGDVLTDGK